jgi:hypothetical protein
MAKQIRLLSKLDVDPSFEKLLFEEVSSNLCEHYNSLRGRTGECYLTGEIVNVMQNGCRDKHNCPRYNNSNGGMR